MYPLERSGARPLIIGLAAAVLAGCGMGGATAVVSRYRQPAGITRTSAGAQPPNVSFTIGISPKKAAGKISPRYISPNTQSMQILVDGTHPVIVDLTSSSPNCAPNPKVSGQYLCTANFNVAAGNHVFSVTAYDLIGARGNVLSTNSTGTVYVAPTGTTTISIALQGVVHYVFLTLATANPPFGKAVAIGLTATLEDVDHNLIFGPAPYDHPVTLTTSDSSNGSLSKTTLRSPADTLGIVANYTGATVAGITFSATATGLDPAYVGNAVLTPGAPGKHLYVANSEASTISVFDLTNGSAVPATIIDDGVGYPWGVAIDASGKMYVADSSDAIIRIFDTAHGNAILPPITGSGLSLSAADALDSDGKLYVATQDFSYVLIFDTRHGNVPLPPIGINYPWGVAVDSAGKLYVDGFEPPWVDVFDTLHDNAALPLITGGGLAAPKSLALDASGKLYVGNLGSDPAHASISIFDTLHGYAALPPITGAGVTDPYGLVIDTSGRLYVANLSTNSVSVFDTFHGNAALAPITGGGLSHPMGMAIH